MTPEQQAANRMWPEPMPKPQTDREALACTLLRHFMATGEPRSVARAYEILLGGNPSSDPLQGVHALPGGVVRVPA